MSDAEPGAELLTLGSYPNVRRAIETFEALVREIANKVMLRHLEEMRLVTGKPGLDEADIKLAELDPVTCPVGVGLAIDAPPASSIMWGVKWNYPEAQEPFSPCAFIAVREVAQRRQEKLFHALVAVSGTQAIRVKRLTGRYNEVHLVQPAALPGTAGGEQIEEALDVAVSAFLDLTRQAGGLKVAMGG